MDRKILNEEGRLLWNRKAQFWDALFGEEGNLFHRRLVEPSVVQLLNLQPGETVLDACCGNGVMARRMAALGAQVTAFDFSEEMLRLARGRGTSAGTAIDYQIVDATDDGAMMQLGARRFDAITCSMALMDIPETQQLFRAASLLLRDSGRFVFATMHPAFNSNNPIFIHEKEDRDGIVSEYHAIKLRAYLDMPPVKGSGAPDESSPHYYYHRPLGTLLRPAFDAGFVLDAMLEPAFTTEDAADSAQLSWAWFTQIPPVLACRLRLR